MGLDVKIPYDFDIWNVFLDTIKTSIRSISGMGLYVLAFIFVWVVMTIVINHFSNISRIKNAVSKRSFTRKVFESDFDKNREELIEDGVRHKRLNLLVNSRMREKHLDELINDQVESRHVSALASREYEKKYGSTDSDSKRKAAAYYRSRKGGKK